MGETYDARIERPDWLLPGTPSGEWKPALCAERPRGERVLRTIEPVTIEKELRPVSIRKVDDGYLYDFGENNAGVCRLHVTAEAGQTITMHHGEHLIDGKLDLTNLTCDRTTGSQKDVYICKAGENVYTPTFTYHGFQYVWIRGLRPEQATEDALTYLVMHTQLPVRGGFRCSDETVNRIHEASMRSTLSNFVHFPTDCPQREKNGWTADAALSAEHTLLYFAPELCYHEWLRNIRGSQAPDGSLPGIVPTAGWGFAWGNGPAWDCVLFWLPYALMQYRNDLDAVRKNAHAMLRYLDYLTTKIHPDGLVAFGLGDWCPAGRGCGDYLAPLELTDSIMAMDICRKAAEMFRRIGRQKQSAFAAELADAFRQSIRSNLIDWETMLVKGNCQTSQAMALYFHVFEETECTQAFARLMEIIEADGERMNVGVLGGRVLFHVLSAYGQSALALQKEELQGQIHRAELSAETAGTLAEETVTRLEALRGQAKDKDENLSRLREELAGHKAFAEELQERLQSLQNSKNGYLYKLKSRSDKQAEAESRQRNSEKLAGEKLQRAQVLSDLEKNYESFNNSVKFVMKQAGAGALRGIVGPVSSLIKTENRYSTAVEIALGAAIQNIVAQDEGAAKRAIALLKERGVGRATFLPLTNLKANPVRESDLAARGGYVGLASELVQCDDRYRVVMDSLLGRTIVTEDIDAATAIAKAYSYRYRVVTLDGQVVNAGGSLTGGSVNKNASILSRRGEIDALTAEAKKYAKQAEELEAQLTELRRETDTIQATVDGIEAEEKTAREDLISAQTLVDRLAANVEEAERLNEQALREYDDLTARMEQLRQQKISGGELVKKLTEEVERLTRLSAEGMAAHEMLTAAITEAAEKVTALQMEDIARQKDCEAVQMAIEQMEGQQSGSEAALAALRERQEQLKKDNEAIREEIEQITAGAQSGSSEIEELHRDIKDADAQRDQLEMRRNILSKENSDVISRREAAASELLRLQEKSEGMQEQQNSISAKMWEEYELTRSEAAEQAIPLEDVGAAQKRLSELRGKIRALGAVNVAAIEEYEEVSGRYRFMKEQIDDAENAKKELTRLITELSAQMSAIFTERFAGINRYFGEIFRELFGGGHAELRLTDATDPLETGIEIIVQPPGKIIKNLSALSGGEQAFVAICIYFAILRVNPAPFVLIDEIEAALDDVNVGKFAAYLHRMTDHTQFISITHRRGTMEQGDVLYGVTMEEEGISKLLRLDVAEMEKKFGKSLN